MTGSRRYTLSEHRVAVRAWINSLLPAGTRVRVECIGGRFDLDMLDRYAQMAPCVLIAILSLSDAGSSGSLRGDMEHNAFVVTKDGADGKRDEQALVLASRLALALKRHGPIAEGGSAKSVRWNTLYSGEYDKRGIAAHVVAWKASVQLSDDDLADDAVEWKTLFAAPDALPPDGDAEAAQIITMQS